MFGKSSGDAYRARHKVVVGPKYSKFGIKSAMVSSLFALGIPAGSANAVDDSNSVLTEESINIVANSLENTPNTTTAADTGVTPKSDSTPDSATPKKRAKRAAADDRKMSEKLPAGKSSIVKNEYVDINDYELKWDEEIYLNGRPVGPLPGRESDPGFKKNTDGSYTYYYDFAKPFDFDYGEMMKRIKAVPTSGSGETYYGRDYFNTRKVNTPRIDGAVWSNIQGFQNDNGEFIDVPYVETQGFTNKINRNTVGTQDRFSKISSIVTADGATLKLVDGAKYGGQIAIRPYTMINELKDAAKNWNFTLQGVDVREPIVKVEETQKALGLADVSIATVDSLDTQFAKNKIDVTDNVTPKNKLQDNAEFKFIDPQNPTVELTLQQVKEAAERGGFRSIIVCGLK
ncbi:hypothetical protein RQN30_01375 [Arcanobacterium hippocoleae]